MTQVVLTVVDTASIQPYIFGSNRLRENIGASYLVHQATHTWPLELLPKPNNLAQGQIEPEKQLDKNQLAAELVFSGGGKTLVLFSSIDQAKSFAQELSRKVLREAPGIRLVIAHSAPFEWAPAGDDLPQRVDQLINDTLEEKKLTLEAASSPLLGLGVTAECTSTGRAATHSNHNQEPQQAGFRLVSSEVIKKLKAVDDAKKRLTQMVEKRDKPLLRGLDFTDELDALGRQHGEESYIAVVHADGNDMGRQIKKYTQHAASNRDYIQKMRHFSLVVEEAGQQALVGVLRQLRRAICRDAKDKEWHCTEVVPKETERTPRFFPLKENYWPFRPLVFGGDDVTFVCNGQVGLSLAAIYLKEFRQKSSSLGIPLNASAGVCVVKVHYPFSRAYEISEKLTGEAKRFLKDDRATASAMDWHFSTTGLAGSLSLIRGREYTAGKEDSLLMRPVRLDDDSQWKTWGNFNHLVLTFNYGNKWAGHRSKLKELREALRAGPDTVKEFLSAYQVKGLPPVRNTTRTPHLDGWEGNRCVYFDALEAMDHHLNLELLE